MAPRTIHALLLSSLLLLGTAGSALAQSGGGNFPTVTVGGNVGFIRTTQATGLLELGLEAPIHITKNYSVGPWMQLGVAKSTVELLFSANSRYTVDVFTTGNLRKLRPYLQGGLGVAYLKVKGAKGIAEFMINMGLGAEYQLSDHMFVASDVMFNIPVSAAGGAGTTTSWQFASLRYRF